MSFAQFASHFLVAAVALCVGLRQQSTTGAFMRLRLVSRVSVPGFFLATSVEQISIALQTTDAILTVVTLIQFLLLVAMLMSVAFDARRAVIRFSNAVAAITEEFDGLVVCDGDPAEKALADGHAKRVHIGTTVLTTINHALYGKD